MRTLTCGPYTIELFVAESVCGIVYAVMDHQSAEEIWCLLKGRGLALAAISGVDWNWELSPWSAPKAFQNGADFGGQASVLLDVLTRQIISLTEEHLRCVPEFRGIAGYSLAGLFALWAVYQTDLFDRAASISGSLWFDGFLDFMRANTPKAKLIYLSLGDREKEIKNPRLAAVEDLYSPSGGAAESTRSFNSIRNEPRRTFSGYPNSDCAWDSGAERKKLLRRSK